MSPSELLERYVLLHNYGVASLDFEPLFELFADDAVFQFKDPRIGTFEGLETIRGVFRRQGPSQAIIVKNIMETQNTATADYTDVANPEMRPGSISVESDGRRITRVYISK